MTDHWRGQIAAKIAEDAKTSWIYKIDDAGNGCRHYPDGSVVITVPAAERETDFDAILNADDNASQRSNDGRPKSLISDEEKARRREIVAKTDHSLRLEFQERDDVSARAAELWINGEITLAEKDEMVLSAMRSLKNSDGRVDE